MEIIKHEPVGVLIGAALGIVVVGVVYLILYLEIKAHKKKFWNK